MEDNINYFEELIRISKTVEDMRDKEILITAAIKLIPTPEPRRLYVTNPAPGYYQTFRAY